MTILMTEGFDHENGNADLAFFGWTNNNNEAVVTGRFGGLANSGFITYTMPGGALTTVYQGHAIQMGGGPVGTVTHEIISFNDGATAQVTLDFDNSTGNISAYRGTTGGTLLGSASAAFTTSAWQYVEIKITINASTGVVQVNIEGTTKLNLTSQNTKNTANTTFSNVSYNSTGGASGFSSPLDDMYQRDDAFCGPCRVYTTYPAANGNSTQWTPASSTNVSQVSETREDGDTSYNSTATLNNEDTFTVGALPGVPLTIFGVSVKYFARKDDATVRAVQSRIRSSTTESGGTSNAMLSTYAGFQDRFDVDPNTSAAWALAAVNAMQIGYKVTT